MDIYEEIRRNLLTGKTDYVVGLVNKAVALCYPPESILKDGLILGVDTLAYKFRNCEVSVPESLMVARALNAGIEALKPYLEGHGKKCCTAILGTVEGDFHDIGKNLVRIYLSTLNIEVIDLGMDVSREEFVEAILEYDAKLLMMSALLPTTIGEMKSVIGELKKRKLRNKVLVFVGGMPVTREYAREIGADYYTRDAIELRDLLDKNLVRMLKELKG